MGTGSDDNATSMSGMKICSADESRVCAAILSKRDRCQSGRCWSNSLTSPSLDWEER